MSKTGYPMRHYYTEYDIQQVCETDKYCAVYAVEAEEGNRGGPLKLISFPLLAIGVASVKRYSNTILSPGKIANNSTTLDETTTQVVGLLFAEGGFEVCNEASNFAGLALVGEDISKVTWFLDSDQMSRLLATSTGEGGE